jgi:hypothetical protein
MVARTLAFVIVRRVLGLVGLGSTPDAKDIEIAVLRHQLMILRRQVARPRYTPQDRLAFAMLARLLPRDRWPVSWSRRRRCCAGSAPRGAWSYPRFSWEELEGTFLGLMAYLDPKGEGDESMPGKQRPCPGVRGGALRDPRDMAKAGLPEAQSPDDACSHPPERRLKPAPRSAPA